MTYAEQLQADYAAIRRRLYAPARAVSDPLPQPVCRDIKVKKEEPELQPKRVRTYPVNSKISKRTKRAAEKAKRIAKRFSASALVPNQDGIPWLDIANSITRATGVTLAEMQGGGRTSQIVNARAMFIYRLKTEITMNGKPVTDGWIAMKLNRDRSTVAHNLQKYARRHNLPLP